MIIVGVPPVPGDGGGPQVIVGGGSGSGGIRPPTGTVTAAVPVPPRGATGGAVPRVPPPQAGAGPTSPPTGAPPVTENRYWPGQIVVQVDRFQPTTVDDQIAQTFNLQRVSSETNALIGRRVILYRIPDQRDARSVVSQVATDARVARAQLNWRYEINQAPGQAVASAGLQYAVAKIRLSGALAIARGAGVTIAVIDSGVDDRHRGLTGSVAKRFDAAGKAGAADPVHGTAIAGIIRSRGTALGVAPDARLISARAFFKTKGFSRAQSSTVILLRALDWSVASGARVINMSFAGPEDRDVSEAVATAAKRGVVMVAAAGNGGPRAKPAYPGAYPDVIAVTATDEYDQLYTMANQGAYIAVAAPGVDVLVLTPGNGHGYTSGTSMAAAHVSGLIALVLERNSTLTLAEVKDVLRRTSRDLGAAGVDPKFGAGRIDAEALLNAVPPPDSPAISMARSNGKDGVPPKK
ncbi:MAG: S8 family serine peptidase [Hyphomicrobiaceae bacterium]|nr:S8 family serine peptidase [Hyphomicrobiaceae bacterium]